jgi:hypothetical protein
LISRTRLAGLSQFSGVHVLCAEDKASNGSPDKRVSGKFGNFQQTEIKMLFSNISSARRKMLRSGAQNLVSYD